MPALPMKRKYVYPGPQSSDHLHYAKSHVALRFEEDLLVTLLVGKEKRVFKIHKDLLFAQSAMLRNMFEAGSDAFEEDTIALPEEDVPVIEKFVRWLYHKGLLFFRDASADELFDYVKLWIFVERYAVSKLGDILFKKMSAFVKVHPKYAIGRDVFRYIYERTYSGSMIRLFFADWYTWDRDSEDYGDENVDSWLLENPAMTTNFFLAAARRKSSRSWLTPKFHCTAYSWTMQHPCQIEQLEALKARPDCHISKKRCRNSDGSP